MSNLRLVVLPNMKDFGKLVEENIKLIRKSNEGLLIDMNLDRFANGEGKASLYENVIGKDVFLLSDVGHYGDSSIYYSRGRECIKSPDDHFQDLKRAISAMEGKANSLHVVTPLLYESRQDKRPKDIDESLDCKEGLLDLEARNVDGVITFDAHNPVACENALKNTSFYNLYPTYSIMKKFIETEEYDPNNLQIVAPDSGAMNRAIYYSNLLGGVDIGVFYKRRDYSVIKDGKNPIIEHKYLGGDVKGKDLIIVDDIIASGGSILEVAKDLKNRGANKIYLVSTFPLFSDGKKSLDKFDEAYKNNEFTKLYATNVTYVPEEILDREWFESVDLSKYLAKIIDAIDEGKNLKNISDGSNRISILMKKLGKYPNH